MKKSNLTFFLAFLLLTSQLFAADLVNLASTNLKVYYTESDKMGADAQVKGKILSFAMAEDLQYTDQVRYAGDKSMVTVRLYKHGSVGLKPGDELYVINRRNLIIARFKVKSIFNTNSLGYLLLGSGNLRLANTGDRIVAVNKVNSTQPFVYKKKGDYFRANGDLGEAQNCYLKALQINPEYPEAHMEMGYLYLNKKMINYAHKEFSEAYKNISNIYDRYDRFHLIEGYLQAKTELLYGRNLPFKKREILTKEILLLIDEGFKLNPQAYELYTLKGRIYFESATPNDLKAKDAFLNAVKYNPRNIVALQSLADLYYRHNNKEKAKEFAKQVLQLDPLNKKMRRYLDEKYFEEK